VIKHRKNNTRPQQAAHKQNPGVRRSFGLCFAWIAAKLPGKRGESQFVARFTTIPVASIPNARVTGEVRQT
jgi:hypothetical protein